MANLPTEQFLKDFAGIIRTKEDVEVCLVFISADGYALMSNWHTGDNRLQSWWQPQSKLVKFTQIAADDAELSFEIYKEAALEALTEETGLYADEAGYSSYFEYSGEYVSGAVMLFVHYSLQKKDHLYPKKAAYIPKDRNYTKHVQFKWYTAADAAVQSESARIAEYEIQASLFARIRNLAGIRKAEDLEISIPEFLKKHGKEYRWHTALVNRFSAEELCAELDSTKDKSIKEKILEAVCMGNISGGMDSAAKLLDDPSPNVRKLAASLIWRCGSKATPNQIQTFGPQVFAALKAESDQTVMWDQITALNQLHYTEAAPYLVTLLAHSYEDVRLAATGALKNICYGEALPKLKEALEKETSEYTAKRMREAIGLLESK